MKNTFIYILLLIFTCSCTETWIFNEETTPYQDQIAEDNCTYLLAVLLVVGLALLAHVPKDRFKSP